MKKTTYLLAIFIAFQTLTFAQYTAIPDANFEQFLIDSNYDSEGGVPDGQILTADANGATGAINVSNSGITDLTGIEAFTGIDGLNVSYNAGITTLDLTSNTLLQFINMEECSALNTLSVSGLSALTSLNLNGTDLSIIDVDTNTALQTINLRNNTNLTSLDLSLNTAIVSVDVKSCALTFLDMRNGNNANVSYFNSEFNSSLTCIYVNDSSEPNLATWTIDGGSTFVETEVECATLSVDSAKATVFSVYPNPATQFVTVSSKSQNATVEIFNVTGRRILSKTLSFGENKLNVSALKSGVYLARFLSDNRTETKKLIIR